MGPYWKLQPFFVHGKYAVEIRILSLNRDNNTHSWVRNSHGSYKFVMNLNNNDTEIPGDQLEEFAVKQNAKFLLHADRKQKQPQRRELSDSSPRIIPMERENWIDIESGKYSFSDYEVSKKATFLLRHSQQMHREENGAVHFCSERKSSEPIPTIYSLARRSMKSMLGSKRRREKNIPVLY